MLKLYTFGFLILFTFFGCKVNQVTTNTTSRTANNNSPLSTIAVHDSDNNIYQFKVLGLEGDTIDFAKFRGKKVLIINTASKCKYTPQYEYLEKLHTTYGNKLVVVGFPSNDFGGQEPGTSEEIREFCTRNYGVTFLMAAKVAVKGKEIAPIYRWLTSKDENGVMDADIKWNFYKFLIDEHGKPMAKFGSKTSPYDDEIVAYLQ